MVSLRCHLHKGLSHEFKSRHTARVGARQLGVRIQAAGSREAFPRTPDPLHRAISLLVLPFVPRTDMRADSCRSKETHDGFSLGILVRAAGMTLGSVARIFHELFNRDYEYLDNIMGDIIWVSGVHDVVCRHKDTEFKDLLTRKQRADVFCRSMELACESDQVNSFRKHLLNAGVKIGSWVGAC